MPTIAIVDGVRLVVYPRDHEPPHMHAFFGEHEVVIDIATGSSLQGHLPRAKLRAVEEWLDANRDRVAYIWQQTRAGQSDGSHKP